ncbi:MAG: hypothetical protein DWQ44_03190 [Bacteroidetes bacterium]|nr:MAG: hypothetical protein DWQ33_04615 [Bacteroidota bacterium]REJ99992.1 MAG: hypothetical protein DWQ39_13885 [Bacteroidota bacterium]REK35828.1 MAG: hypothetical protein DWQ44_03190 [Bacteroidota bacterium]REK49301.1 MAG: hypothetical protein DWQ48_07665 [Bacteroidota bacterium]
MKFLVPTDFSIQSEVAVMYASRLATELESELLLLYVLFTDEASNTAQLKSTETIEKELTQKSSRKFAELIRKIRDYAGVNLQVSFAIRKGFPIEKTIEAHAKENDTELIVMGTRGGGPIRRLFMGSTAASVIGYSSLPVITVPENAEFKGLKHIVYPTNMWTLEEELDALVPLARIFSSTIHVLHVVSPDSAEKPDKEKVLQSLIEKTNYEKIIFHISKNSKVVDGIDAYMELINADLLAMFTHELTFLEKLFGKSLTRQMVFHSKTPMLTFIREV